MKLAQYHRDAIYRSVVNDMPTVDSKKLKETIQAALVKAMSPECRKLYRKTPSALATVHNCSAGLGYGDRTLVVGDCDAKAVLAVLAPFEAAHQARQGLLQKLKGGINACKTRKQLVDTFPEFTCYLPAETEKCPTLPAVANLVADLVKAGWNQKVSKA